MAAEKLDLYKIHKGDYKATQKPRILDIKPAQYITIVGAGAPGEESFQTKFEALYGMAFTVKMNSKKAGRDYVVCKLEGLYWLDDTHASFDTTPKEKWHWKMLIRTPDFITDSEMAAAAKNMKAKGKGGEEVDNVKLETIGEGKCVQIMHIGPYDQEEESISTMHGFARDSGYELHGLHHEIYFNDPRRVAPEKLKTILRHPVK